ncbi:hypothetical protein PGT21_020456 [Puccinia graminis f. sp. tritici]|uniref:Uncharacterized protein n=1 Tax=Puccinia graminis f. sp. tritici TaxID=56615 RepID=A0A5B0N7X5_PUCGR|nr:hypothetical protein PGT21_020456 [Puccinia graminis f. sp. tritici]
MGRPPALVKWSTSSLLLGAWAIITASTNDQFVPGLHSTAHLLDPRAKCSDIHNDDINFVELDEYLSSREIGGSSTSVQSGQARSSPVQQKHADIFSQPLKLSSHSARKSPTDCSLALQAKTSSKITISSPSNHYQPFLPLAQLQVSNSTRVLLITLGVPTT